MKGDIICPECMEKQRLAGRKPKVLAKYNDVVGKGDLYLYCKVCKKEVHIRIDDIILDK